MKKTYVFDFYNLYIPENKTYVNEKEGIRINPLKLAKEFEKNRKKLSSPFRKYGWNTAKCFIKADSMEKAKITAELIEFIYSFAQNRSIFFQKCYEYKKGKRYFSAQSKFIEPRENRFSELIHGVHTRGSVYTRDISLFIDTAIEKLSELNYSEKHEILTSMNSLNISKSKIVVELKFLICWIALEKLANKYYKSHKGDLKKYPNLQCFERKKLKELKKELNKFLEKILKKDSRLPYVKKSLNKNYLYEYDTYQKIWIYLKSLDLGFDERKLSLLLKRLKEIRVDLVHDLNSKKLIKNPEYLMYLQKIMEKVIFRLLGITKSLESKFIINQYNRGNEL